MHVDLETDYRQLIENLGVAVYTVDVEGDIQTYNIAAVELWGREPEAGTRWSGASQLYDPEGFVLPLSTYPVSLVIAEARAVPAREIMLARPDGSLRNVSASATPILDESGKLKGAVGVLVDITAHKQQIREKTEDIRRKNEELREKEVRYHRMIEEVEDYAIILLDRNGTIENWNKGAKKIKGYSDEEVIGRNFSIFYPEEDRRAGSPQMIIEEATEKGKAVSEGWRVRKDGSRFWGSILVTALHNAQGAVIGFSKVTRDLTQKKAAEDKLQRYSNELEFQNKELEQFVYAASHDIKEPLRKIHFYSDFINDDPDNKLSPKSTEYLHRAINAAKRMRTLIDDLLLYSRMGLDWGDNEEVDLDKAVAEIVSTHREEIEQYHVRLIAEGLPKIRAVPFQLMQLLNNLITNAIKYRRPGISPVIEIGYRTVPGDQTGEREALRGTVYHEISVSDNGIGFDPQFAEKIFEIFKRLDSQSAVDGTGIGLAICKRIVQHQKGFIKAEGRPGEGASFRVYLPVASGRRSAVETEKRSTRGRSEGRNTEAIA